MCISKKHELLNLFQVAVSAAHPDQCLAKFLPKLPDEGNIYVLGAGKGSAAMVRALEAHYLTTGQAGRLQGSVVTRYGYSLPTRFIPIIEAAHPVPDQSSTMAASRALEIASNAGEGDIVIVLLSGGASALWSAPLPGLTLDIKQSVTKALLRSGAAIDEINCLRKHLSSIKGGKLAAAAYPATVLTYAISDVPHDDVSSIGSGPTVGDPTSSEQALQIIEKYKLDVPERVTEVLQDPWSESLFPGEQRLENSHYRLVATPGMALKAASEKLSSDGYEVINLGDSLEGEARDVGAYHARLALDARDTGKKVALLSSGELTVTIQGDGYGGPNQEYALGLAVALDGAENIWAFAGDTDGIDGGNGKDDDAAGAFVDPHTLSRAVDKGLNPASFLDNNDSGGFFGALDDLLVCGATQTNVNDFRVILANSDAKLS